MYLPDRVVAIVYESLMVWNSVAIGDLRLEGPPDDFDGWWPLVNEAGAVLVFGWVLLGVARLRLWGFVTTSLLALITVWTSGTHDNLGLLGLSSFLFLYLLLRMFGILGPKPSRTRVVLRG